MLQKAWVIENGDRVLIKGTYFPARQEPTDLLKYINVSRFDYTVLLDLPEYFKQKLIEYQQYTDMTDDRINKLSDGLNYRINTLIKNTNVSNKN